MPAPHHPLRTEDDPYATTGIGDGVSTSAFPERERPARNAYTLVIGLLECFSKPHQYPVLFIGIGDGGKIFNVQTNRIQ